MTGSAKRLLDVIPLCASIVIALIAGTFFLNTVTEPDSISAARTSTGRSAAPQGHAPLPQVERVIGAGSSYLERPLFGQSRQLPSPVIPTSAEQQRRPVLAPPLPVPPPSLPIIIGVIITSERSIAVMKIGQNGPAQYIEVGQEIARWTVESISPMKVAMRYGDLVRDLAVFPQELQRQ